MAEQHFSVASPDGAFYNGKHMLGTGCTGTLINGMVVTIDTNGYITRNTGAVGAEAGLAYEPMAFVEYPTTNNLVTYMTQKYCNFAAGNFQGFVGKDLFVSGALPPIGAYVYAQSGASEGLLGITGVTGTSVPIGRMQGSATLAGITGGTETVARVQFNFDIH